MEAQLLAAFGLGWDWSALLGRVSDSADMALADQTLSRRLNREPLAYIFGVREFWKDVFHVGPGVLIPRPDTEVLVEAALGFEASDVLDLCTGSGAVALSLAREKPSWWITGSDVSPDALGWAKRNGEALDRSVRWVLADGFQGLGTFDLIVCNPPYVAPDHALEEELSHEPRLALFAENNGLAFYERLASEAATHLNPGGALLIEIGYDQSESVPAVFAAWNEIGRWKDLNGITRVLGFRPR